jgi:hypothetical protein
MAELQVEGRDVNEQEGSRLPNQEFADNVEEDLDKPLSDTSRAGFIRKVTIHQQIRHF